MPQRPPPEIPEREREKIIEPTTPAEALAEYAERTGTYLIDPRFPSYAPGEFIGPGGEAVKAETIEEAKAILESRRELERKEYEREIAAWRAASLAERELERKRIAAIEPRAVPIERPPTEVIERAEIVKVPPPVPLRERVVMGVERVRAFVAPKRPGVPVAVSHVMELKDFIGTAAKAEVKRAKGPAIHTYKLARYRPKQLAREIGVGLKEIGKEAYAHPVETVVGVGVGLGAAAVAPVATGTVLTGLTYKAFVEKPERGLAEAGLLIGGAAAIKGARISVRRVLPRKEPTITPYIGEARLKDVGLIAEYGISRVKKGKLEIISEPKAITEITPISKARARAVSELVIKQRIIEPKVPERVEYVGAKIRTEITPTEVKGLSAFIGKAKIKEGVEVKEFPIIGKVRAGEPIPTPKGLRTELAVISAALEEPIRPPKLVKTYEYPSVFERAKLKGRAIPRPKERVKIEYGFEIKDVLIGRISFKEPKRLGIPFRVGEPRRVSFEGVRVPKTRALKKIKRARRRERRWAEFIAGAPPPKRVSKDIFTMAREAKAARLEAARLEAAARPPAIPKITPEIPTAPKIAPPALKPVPYEVAEYDKPIVSLVPAITEKLAVTKIEALTRPGVKPLTILRRKAEVRVGVKPLQVPIAGKVQITRMDRRLAERIPVPAMRIEPRIIPRVKISPKIAVRPIEKVVPKEKVMALEKMAVEPRKPEKPPALPKAARPRPPRGPSILLLPGRIREKPVRRVRKAKPRKRRKERISPLADPLSFTITEARTFKKARHLRPTKRVRQAFARALMEQPGVLRFPTYEMAKRKGGLRI